MKSTYKLFGTIWDGIDTVQGDSGRSMIMNRDKKTAIISFAKLLSANELEEVDAVVSDYKDAPEWLIEVDYWCSKNKCIVSFLNKRLNQMVTYLELKYGKKTKYSFNITM